VKGFESNALLVENRRLCLERMRAMKFEGTFQYMGTHGIVFNVSQITLTDSERGRLRELHFSLPPPRPWPPLTWQYL
jgi:hypothetical protein